MYNRLTEILEKDYLSLEDIIVLLNTEGNDIDLLFDRSRQVKYANTGNEVYLRGLIEFSNICKKNCYYCGIRSCNKNFPRYEVELEDIENACRYAIDNDFASMVLQSGEVQNSKFISKITESIRMIKELSQGKIRITLSCGEQSPAVYKEWFETGAERYLIRMETTNPKLYTRLHPKDIKHNFNIRLSALKSLQDIGYQVGTGVMIGLPFQKVEDLANDILFMQHMDIDMVGMGPYIEHRDTPLYDHRNQLLSLDKRYELSLKMIAILRIVMKDINIASTTALQAINSAGKRNALQIGANVIMPNLTPLKYKENYHLYENKPGQDINIDAEMAFVREEVAKAGGKIAFGQQGDSKHFVNRSLANALQAL